MSRPVTWWRLYRGKVWHVGWAGDAAACGTEPGKTAEYVGERAPVNARVCGDCVSMALHLYALAQAGQMGDPRTPERGLISVPGAPLPEADDGVVDVEIVDECCPCPCDNPEHAGYCCDCYLSPGHPGCDESANQIPADVTPPATDNEWPCGGCGHPNLDHDCDDGTCTVTNDDPGVNWGTCPCRGLKRAG